jgi:hypothetical protein
MGLTAMSHRGPGGRRQLCLIDGCATHGGHTEPNSFPSPSKSCVRLGMSTHLYLLHRCVQGICKAIEPNHLDMPLRYTANLLILN